MALQRHEDRRDRLQRPGRRFETVRASRSRRTTTCRKPASADFDDSAWETIEPAALEARRSTGKLCFNWYRTTLTIPERVGAFETRGSTVVFEIVVDDYAEIWVDGQLPRVLGQTGGALVKGFNAPNRVVLTTNARPGQRIQLAILGVNGPLSDPPSNFIWVRSATLDFFKPGATSGRQRRHGSRASIPPSTRSCRATRRSRSSPRGFSSPKGPSGCPSGYLLFSDPNTNTIYRWSDTDGVVGVQNEERLHGR